ncbi:MAG: transposase [Nitrospira sp.]|nr:transposase [Nitrospira sp.]
MRYRVIQEEDPRDPIRLMYCALAVSPVGYTHGVGVPRGGGRLPIGCCLPPSGGSIKTVARPMTVRASGGRSAHRASRWETPRIRHTAYPWWHTLQRQFTGSHPNQVWAIDITYGMDHGRVVVSGRVVGSILACRHRLGDGPSLDRRFNPPSPPHGDQNPASPSRTGNCWDNACVESFFGTLKRELVYHRQYTTRSEATQDIL